MGREFGPRGPLSMQQRRAPAIRFPGPSGQGLDRGSASLTNTQGWSFSFWMFREASQQQYIFAAGTLRQLIQLLNPGVLHFSSQNAALGASFACETVANQFVPQERWQHACGYVDTAVLNDTGMFINGASVALNIIGFVQGDSLFHNNGGLSMGNQVGLGSATRGLVARVSQAAIWPRKIDWGVPSNMALVRRLDGKAVVLPDNGNIDGLGNADYCVNKPLRQAHVSGGTGGNFVAATAGMIAVDGPEI